ncbi:TetR family transcriptional regulator [Anaerocolumna sedimenticola]|uniref:TetR family transcriptional regulator n=1 Tax=Anaerocolumna sedimenticola TaxID=2696063 RepID=A0A6P1TSK4_9FIRM|nr:TetR/AcrR family transcriptional regulator [Anaerocolumna sedimenticola]QHQ63242.1 TetR family transcriptional regulator [Anaerocolumna sedimenticola]
MTMEEEKRERFIEVALREFSKGYTAANTDVIVKEAGISKGLLFHYFGSKRGLFLFLNKYVLDIFITEYEKVISDSCDFLENIKTVSNLKRDLSSRYPLIFGFMMKAYLSINDVFPEGLPGDLVNLNYTLMKQIYERSNKNKTILKDGIDKEKAQNIIIWTMNGFTESLFRYGDEVDAYKAHFDDAGKELEEYLQTLRKILYR